MTWALDAALCALILTVGWATVVGQGVFRAIVFFIVYGLLMALAWVRLDAVDVALAEAAIGAGLTGVLFLSAFGRLAQTVSDDAAPGRVHLPAALACGGLTGALAWAWFTLPVPERPVWELAEAMPGAGVEKPRYGYPSQLSCLDTLLRVSVPPRGF